MIDLTSFDRRAYERDGYVVVRGVVPAAAATAQLDAAVAIARRRAGGVFDDGAFVTPEMNLAGTVDHTFEQKGYSINDWMPALRK